MAADLRSFLAGAALAGSVAGGAVVAQSKYEEPQASSVCLFPADEHGECRAMAQIPVKVAGEKEALASSSAEFVVSCENFARSLEEAKVVNFSRPAGADDFPDLPFKKYEPAPKAPQ
jgi:hypothetical protein